MIMKKGILFIFLMLFCAGDLLAQRDYVILVHGGAGNIKGIEGDKEKAAVLCST